VQSPEMKPKLSGWADVLEPKWDDRPPNVERRRDFIEDMARGIGRGGENDDDELGLGDRVNDGFGPTFARGNVSRSDPAPYTGFLQVVANRIGRRLIVVAIANESIMRQSRVPASLPRRTEMFYSLGAS